MSVMVDQLERQRDGKKSWRRRREEGEPWRYKSAGAGVGSTEPYGMGVLRFNVWVNRLGRRLAREIDGDFTRAPSISTTGPFQNRRFVHLSTGVMWIVVRTI